MPDEVENTSKPPKEGTDYTDRAKKGKPGEPADDKDVKQIVSSESVSVQKKGIGSKIRDLFVAADFKSVMGYVVYDIFIPAARNMIVDGAARGAERLIYGESRHRRGPMGPGQRSRITYNSPINRGETRDPRTSPPDRSTFPRGGRSDYILKTRDDADMVLDAMYDLLSKYEVVSVHDLKELVGFPTSHVDNKWGWFDLRGVDIRPVRQGFMIDLPPEESI